MSTDIVDDLHAAEDQAGAGRRLAEHVSLVLEDRHALFTHDQIDEVRSLLAALSEPFCRPSCGFLDGRECESGGPDNCGCPCGHGEE